MSSTDTSTDRVISPKKLKSLILDASQKTAKIQSIAGEMGERIKTAIENDHLHRGAFKLMVRLHKMDELKRNDFLRSIAIYTTMCRELELFGDEHEGDLADEAGQEGDEEEIRAANQEEADRIMREAAEAAAPKRRGRPPKATVAEEPAYKM